jgi:hypothetical protein
MHIAPYSDALGELIWSTNAGLDSRRQPDPAHVDGLRPLACVDLAAASASDWWILCSSPGGMNHSENVLRHTTDGGHTWTTVSAVVNLSIAAPPTTIPAVDPDSLAAASANLLWLTGSIGGLAQSSTSSFTTHRSPFPTAKRIGSFSPRATARRGRSPKALSRPT